MHLSVLVPQWPARFVGSYYDVIFRGEALLREGLALSAAREGLRLSAPIVGLRHITTRSSPMSLLAT